MKVGFHSKSIINYKKNPYCTPLRFRERFNLGGAYSQSTGYFTAPVSGYYYFASTVSPENKHGDESASDPFVTVAIVVGNENMSYGFSESVGMDWNLATVTAFVHVDKGQKVYVNSRRELTTYQHMGLCTFSGFLVYPDL